METESTRDIMLFRIFLNFNNKLETDFAFKYNLRKLLKGLSIDGKFSYDAGWSNNRSIQQRPNIYQYNPVNGTYKQGLEMVLPTKATNKTAATHRKYAEAAVRYKQSASPDIIYLDWYFII